MQHGTHVCLEDEPLAVDATQYGFLMKQVSNDIRVLVPRWCQMVLHLPRLNSFESKNVDAQVPPPAKAVDVAASH